MSGESLTENKNYTRGKKTFLLWSLAFSITFSLSLPSISAEEVHPGAIESHEKPLSGSVSNVLRRSLLKGPLLLSPTEQDTVVETPFGQVGTAINSMALIIVTDKTLTVYDLHDGKRNAIVVTHGSETFELIPGGTLSITKAAVDNFNKINPASFVCYRAMHSRSIEDGLKEFQGEFNVATMVSGLPQLNTLRKSPDPRVRKIMENMLKTAVIMSQLSRTNEPFKLYL